MAAVTEASWKMITIVLFATAIAKREFPKESEATNEDDVSEEVYTKKHDRGIDRTPTTIGPTKGEVVVEKFVETLMSSERYLRMMETVERKINHLDATFHERTNTIIKYLSELLRMIKSSAANELEIALKGVKGDLDKLKTTIANRLDPEPNMRASKTVKRDKCIEKPSYYLRKYTNKIKSWANKSLELIRNIRWVDHGRPL